MSLTESEHKFQSNWRRIRLGCHDKSTGIAPHSKPTLPSFSMRIRTIVNENHFESQWQSFWKSMRIILKVIEILLQSHACCSSLQAWWASRLSASGGQRHLRRLRILVIDAAVQRACAWFRGQVGVFKGLSMVYLINEVHVLRGWLKKVLAF